MLVSQDLPTSPKPTPETSWTGRGRHAEVGKAPREPQPWVSPCGSARQPQAARGSGALGGAQVGGRRGAAHPAALAALTLLCQVCGGRPGQSIGGQGARAARTSGEASLSLPPAGRPHPVPFASLAPPGAATMEAAFWSLPVVNHAQCTPARGAAGSLVPGSRPSPSSCFAGAVPAQGTCQTRGHAHLVDLP